MARIGILRTTAERVSSVGGGACSGRAARIARLLVAACLGLTGVQVVAAESGPGEISSAAALSEAVAAAASARMPLLPGPGWQRQGQAAYRWWGLLVYDAELWSAAPVTADNFEQRELVLELTYARRFRGRTQVERILQEMSDMEPLPLERAETWRERLLEIFPGVQVGDRLAAWQRPGGGLSFFHNGAPVGELADPEFARRFLGVWLSRASPAPAFHQALLGQAP